MTLRISMLALCLSMLLVEQPLADSTFTEGYGGATWGLSKDSVRTIYSQKHILPTRGAPFYVDSILGELCNVDTKFHSDSLYQVSVTFALLDKQTSAQAWMEDLIELMIRKYGMPKTALGKDLYSGQVIEWETKESRITAVGTRGTYGSAASIVYTCKMLTLSVGDSALKKRDSTLDAESGKL